MNREEALRLASYDETPYYFQRLINKIYDDLNSRTCENCKYFQKGWFCEKINAEIYPDYEIWDNSGFHVNGYDVEKDFGCNRFERKDIK